MKVRINKNWKPFPPKKEGRIPPWTVTQFAENFREDCVGMSKENQKRLRKLTRDAMRVFRDSCPRQMTPGELSVLHDWDL